MRLKLLGKSGLRVSDLCLGTMTFGTSWGFGADRAVCLDIVKRYHDEGGNFIDTANVYTDGESESILGDILRGIRREFVLTTKYSLLRDPKDANSLGNHRRNLVLSVEESLARLQTDFLDLLWVHAWYFENEVSDVARAIDDVIKSGKVFAWGISDSPAWLCAEANCLAQARGWVPPTAIQVEYSLIERSPERELIPFALRSGLGIAAWAPLGGGALSGKHHSQENPDTLRAERVKTRRNARVDEIVRSLIVLATERETTPAKLALAWIRRTQPETIPIVGARSAAQLQENIDSLDLRIDDDAIAALSNVSAVELGFPGEMLASPRMKEVMYGRFRG